MAALPIREATRSKVPFYYLHAFCMQSESEVAEDAGAAGA
jgi:hypothetical protein